MVQRTDTDQTSTEQTCGRTDQMERSMLNITHKDRETNIWVREPSGGETTWTNTGATRYGRGQHTTGLFGDGTVRPSPNHGTQRLPNDDDDDDTYVVYNFANIYTRHIDFFSQERVNLLYE